MFFAVIITTYPLSSKGVCLFLSNPLVWFEYKTLLSGIDQHPWFEYNIEYYCLCHFCLELTPGLSSLHPLLASSCIQMALCRIERAENYLVLPSLWMQWMQRQNTLKWTPPKVKQSYQVKLFFRLSSKTKLPCGTNFYLVIFRLNDKSYLVISANSQRSQKGRQLGMCERYIQSSLDFEAAYIHFEMCDCC